MQKHSIQKHSIQNNQIQLRDRSASPLVQKVIYAAGKGVEQKGAVPAAKEIATEVTGFTATETEMEVQTGEESASRVRNPSAHPYRRGIINFGIATSFTFAIAELFSGR